MLNDFSVEARFVLCALAIWRLTHLIVAEDGPWNIIVRVRVFLGDSQAGQAMDCFYCLSVWLAIPFTFVIANHFWNWIICWLALSAAASLLEQATNRDINRAHLARPKLKRNKMSCCGQNRQAWREWNKPKVQAPAPSPPVLQNPVTLHHLGKSSLVLQGSVTRYTYLFAGHETSLAVDERDVPTLMATGQFSIQPP